MISKYPRSGRLEERENREPLEPGSISFYHFQQATFYRAIGQNCTDRQFAEWFIYIHGGLLVGEGPLITDLGDIDPEVIGVELDLCWDDYLAQRYPI